MTEEADVVCGNMLIKDCLYCPTASSSLLCVDKFTKSVNKRLDQGDEDAFFKPNKGTKHHIQLYKRGSLWMLCDPFERNGCHFLTCKAVASDCFRCPVLGRYSQGGEVHMKWAKTHGEMRSRYCYILDEPHRMHLLEQRKNQCMMCQVICMDVHPQSRLCEDCHDTVKTISETSGVSEERVYDFIEMSGNDRPHLALLCDAQKVILSVTHREQKMKEQQRRWRSIDPPVEYPANPTCAWCSRQIIPLSNRLKCQIECAKFFHQDWYWEHDCSKFRRREAWRTSTTGPGRRCHSSPRRRGARTPRFARRRTRSSRRTIGADTVGRARGRYARKHAR